MDTSGTGAGAQRHADGTMDREAARQAALQEWDRAGDRDWDGGLVGRAPGRHPGRLQVVTVAVAAVAMALVWWQGRRGGGGPAAGEAPDLSIAPRKAVSPLKAVTDAPAANVVVPDVELRGPAEPDGLAVQRQQLALQAAEQARRLRVARLKSAIVVHGASPGGTSAGFSGGMAGGLDGVAPHAASGTTIGPGRGAQDADSQYARSVSGQGVPLAVASRIDGLAHKILQGKMIDAVLLPRALSDLPGTVCATVQRDVYAEQGRLVLIPWGSRVCGVYRAALRPGQARLFTVWNTLRRPDGGQVVLDSIGADQLGTSGMGGHVDTHFAARFGVAALISLMGAGAATAGVAPSDAYNAAAAYRQAVQQAAAQTSQQTLQSYLNIPPTVTVAAGERIRILVNRDLDFTALYRRSQGAGGDADKAEEGPAEARPSDVTDTATAWLTVVPSPS